MGLLAWIFLLVVSAVLAFLGEVLTDTFLAYHLPTALFLAIHPFLYWGTILTVFGGGPYLTRVIPGSADERSKLA